MARKASVARRIGIDHPSGVRALCVAVAVLFFQMNGAQALERMPLGAMSQGSNVTLVAASCKQASSCEEAVQMWCDGYRRADGDRDGIPCENVCHSLGQVQKIMQEIDC